MGLILGFRTLFECVCMRVCTRACMCTHECCWDRHCSLSPFCQDRLVSGSMGGDTRSTVSDTDPFSSSILSVLLMGFRSLKFEYREKGCKTEKSGLHLIHRFIGSRISLSLLMDIFISSGQNCDIWLTLSIKWMSICAVFGALAWAVGPFLSTSVWLQP